MWVYTQVLTLDQVTQNQVVAFLCLLKQTRIYSVILKENINQTKPTKTKKPDQPTNH